MKLISRIINAILNITNRYKKKVAANDPSNAIANGGRVQQSDDSYRDLAQQSGSDKTQ